MPSERIQLWDKEGVEGGRKDGGDLTNVQYKPNWNCHYEFPQYNTCILIKKESNYK
jgi:hypothetical protein